MTEGCTVKCCIGHSEPGMVEDVSCFGAEGEVHAFFDRDCLEESSVPVAGAGRGTAQRCCLGQVAELVFGTAVKALGLINPSPRSLYAAMRLRADIGIRVRPLDGSDD
jgi:hypothetical protein